MVATSNGRSSFDLIAPPSAGEAITPSDTTTGANEFSTFSRYIYIGGAGAVRVITTAGSTLTFSAVPVGTMLPVQAKQVLATGTTATDMLALW